MVNKIPPACELNSDPLLIEVVLHNLIDNAVKATRDGMITVRIQREEEAILLLVEDTGYGIREEIAHFYNREDPADAEPARPAGIPTGFGLHIVNELTRLIGVRLRIESTAGGTAVCLIFKDSRA